MEIMTEFCYFFPNLFQYLKKLLSENASKCCVFDMSKSLLTLQNHVLFFFLEPFILRLLNRLEMQIDKY